MGAPKNNQFWRLRSKNGRDKIFSSGQAILDAADEYMEILDNTPLIEHDFVGKDAMEVWKHKKHVPTWPGFASFCGVHSGHFRKLRENYKGSDDPLEKDIFTAIMRVDDIFHHDKFAAASAGLANPSLIGKDLGLIDKKDLTTDGQKIESNVIPNIIVEVVRPNPED